MSGFRIFAMGIVLTLAWSVAAQEAASGGAGSEPTRSSAQSGVPSADEQLKILTARLVLSGDQQSKMKRILDDLHDNTVKIVQEPGLSHEERLAKVRPLRYKARDQMRAILNDEQKQKLDEYLQGPHPEMHGSLH